MLLAPIAVFLATVPVSRRMKPCLYQLYKIIGGFVVFFGSGISYYFAAYTGDQGGKQLTSFKLLSSWFMYSFQHYW